MSLGHLVSLGRGDIAEGPGLCGASPAQPASSLADPLHGPGSLASLAGRNAPEDTGV